MSGLHLIAICLPLLILSVLIVKIHVHNNPAAVFGGPTTFDYIMGPLVLLSFVGNLVGLGMWLWSFA